MIQLPETTYVGKKIPKEGFYSNLTLSASVKRAFVDDIEQIVWNNVLSTATLNVGKGEKVGQIDVVHIILKKQDFEKNILDVIEKAIPRHLLFIMKYNDTCQLHINFKEEYQKGKYKIVDSFCTSWMPQNEINISVRGLDLDQVYENFIYQIAGNHVVKSEDTDLKQSIQQAQEISKIKKKIDELQKKKWAEKQFNIQIRISEEIKKLEKKLCTLENN